MRVRETGAGPEGIEIVAEPALRFYREGAPGKRGHQDDCRNNERDGFGPRPGAAVMSDTTPYALRLKHAEEFAGFARSDLEFNRRALKSKLLAQRIHRNRRAVWLA